MSERRERKRKGPQEIKRMRLFAHRIAGVHVRVTQKAAVPSFFYLLDSSLGTRSLAPGLPRLTPYHAGRTSHRPN